MIERMNDFKQACKGFLSGFSLNELRAYAREIGVDKPTKDKKKEVLVDEIILVLAGEIAPQPISLRGAPVKNDFVNPKIKDGVDKIRLQFSQAPVETIPRSPYDIKARLKPIKDNPFMLVVEDPNAKELEKGGVREIFRGQLQTLNDIPMLLPLNCIESDQPIIMPVELIHQHDIREGDIVSCYARKKNSFLIVTNVLTINDLLIGSFERGNYDEEEVCFPHEKIRFYSEKCNSLTSKALQWAFPVGKGQRVLLVSPPKAGKSNMIYEIANATSRLNKDITPIVLLVDSSPECVSRFRKVVDQENLLYTTYEDSPERQVFVADFALKRVKRFSEMGRNVLLLVDSFNALARAYNETKDSMGGKVLPCGLESKTVQYLKRYFGTARCFEKRGSITILGAVSMDTGSPMDETIKTELTNISNSEIYLSEELAKRRIYPAIDIVSTQSKNNDTILNANEEAFDAFMRNDYFSKHGMEDFVLALEKTNSFEEFEKLIRQ